MLTEAIDISIEFFELVWIFPLDMLSSDAIFNAVEMLFHRATFFSSISAEKKNNDFPLNEEYKFFIQNFVFSQFRLSLQNKNN